MNRLIIIGLACLVGCTQEQFALRDMGSFHVGGREVDREPFPSN
jgi:hypothetical protein